MDEITQRAYNRLEADCLSGRCGLYISSLSELERLTIYNYLEYERLQRKHDDMIALYKECGENWNEVFFVSLLTRLSGAKNKASFKKLAQRVKLNTIHREKWSIMNVEAILLGASGILELYPKDSYIMKLIKESEYFMRKHNIEPMHHSEWVLQDTRPVNHPAIRLAQVATLFCNNERLFDRAMACRNLADVEAIFSVEASEYWTKHYTPGKISTVDKYRAKRIGRTKCNILGINIIVSMQYAYGLYLRDENITNRAEELLAGLQAENNKLLKPWRTFNVRPRNAFDTQALIQLYTEYCMLKGCRNCIVAHKTIKNLSWIVDYK